MAKAKVKAKAKMKSRTKPKEKAKPKSKTKAKAKPKAKATSTKTKQSKPTSKPAKNMTTTTKKVSKPAASKQATPKVKNDLLAFGPIGFKPYKLAKDEGYMEEGQLNHFRQILLLWKQQLLEEFDRTKQHMQNDAANYPDPLDRASQEEEFNFELRTRDRERKLVKKIEEALDSIENKDYGFCVECGAEIGIRRLEARPTATQCIDCKTFEEIREKQIAS